MGRLKSRRNDPLALAVFALAYLAITIVIFAPRGFFLAAPPEMPVTASAAMALPGNTETAAQ